MERAERKPRIPSGHVRGKALRGAVATIVTIATIALATMAASLVVSCAASPKPAPAPLPAPEPSKPNLADLIAAGNLNGIKTFFASQDQLNTPDDQGSYPLHRAVEIGSAKTVELLLALGAKPEVKDKAGLSPLRLAIDKGAIDCVKVLADKGADIFSADQTGVTVLEAALAKGGDVLSAAFNAKNVNAKGADGETALHMAADRLLEDHCARLLAAGADARPPRRARAGRPSTSPSCTPTGSRPLAWPSFSSSRAARRLSPDFAWFTQAARPSTTTPFATRTEARRCIRRSSTGRRASSNSSSSGRSTPTSITAPARRRFTKPSGRAGSRGGDAAEGRRGPQRARRLRQHARSI